MNGVLVLPMEVLKPKWQNICTKGVQLLHSSIFADLFACNLKAWNFELKDHNAVVTKVDKIFREASSQI